ncbi:hypothetical protein [Rhodococcus spongiicola]|uniref:Uncharacterized protein n=1 Tax=Rhodococcus spongiicola TaxID=2487352 RepID=A0A438B0G1_9NOCA|nr:hypothetical protein [Rhodococcus spongiicola]RVW04444.1 hypothetical protein EF834_05005 [Rhodococcus spongiicola]
MEPFTGVDRQRVIHLAHKYYNALTNLQEESNTSADDVGDSELYRLGIEVDLAVDSLTERGGAGR